MRAIRGDARFLVAAFCWTALAASAAAEESLQWTARKRPPTAGLEYSLPEYAPLDWKPSETAVILCDLWDRHWCRGATGRVGELAPRVDQFLAALRSKGVLVIHAPSDCMKFYAGHLARKTAVSAPKAADAPVLIGRWCNQIPSETKGKYPLDQSDGGCDCHPHCKQGGPWTRQHPAVRIEDRDAISDSGFEIWNLLQDRKIKNVAILGVHTNMCVLGRPFGLRNLSRYGKNVVLVRDLTDTMYNSEARPHVSHFTGNDRIVEHIEKFVCPTVTSDQVLGGAPLRFREDRRPRVVLLLADKEYKTDVTLPAFSQEFLGKDFCVSTVSWEKKESHRFAGMGEIDSADLLLVSAWRRQPPKEQLDVLRKFVADGKPIVGVRTATHAFARREGWKLPPGHDEWPEFDREVLGCRYVGHHGNHAKTGVATFVQVAAEASSNPTAAALVAGLPKEEFAVPSWLYKCQPLGEKATLLLRGRAGDRKPIEPVAWTNISSGSGKVFCTTLGHPDDFKLPAFQLLLYRGIYWAAGLPIPKSLPSPVGKAAAFLRNPKTLEVVP